VQGSGAFFEGRGRSPSLGVRGLFKPSNTIAITGPRYLDDRAAQISRPQVHRLIGIGRRW
jgi:hypothetical protein